MKNRRKSALATIYIEAAADSGALFLLDDSCVPLGYAGFLFVRRQEDGVLESDVKVSHQSYF
jgi:hypothetical protein